MIDKWEWAYIELDQSLVGGKPAITNPALVHGHFGFRITSITGIYVVDHLPTGIRVGIFPWPMDEVLACFEEVESILGDKLNTLNTHELQNMLVAELDNFTVSGWTDENKVDGLPPLVTRRNEHLIQAA